MYKERKEKKGNCGRPCAVLWRRDVENTLGKSVSSPFFCTRELGRKRRGDRDRGTGRQAEEEGER